MRGEWPQYNLTDSEWRELVTLEYVLTQGYYQGDKQQEEISKRIYELRKRKVKEK